MKRSFRHIIICLAILTPVLAGCSDLSTDYSSLTAHMTESIEEQMEENQVIGLSIALVDGKDIAWSEGFGYADDARRVPATADTLYGIGSISKTFTGIAVMQLAEQGLVDLDEPVHEYIPEFTIRSRFPDPISAITVRTLLTHHSGIPGDKLQDMFSSDNGEFRDDILDYLAGQYVANPPNHIFAYSNLGFELLGILIERVSEIPFADSMAENLLDPLGMNTASFVPISLRDDVSSLVSLGYHGGQSEGHDEPPLRSWPAGSMNASVNDMARYIMMILSEGSLGGNRVIGEDSLDEMLTPQNGDVPLDLGVVNGLAFFLSNPNFAYAGSSCGHDGGTIFYLSTMHILPDQELGVIVLTNTDTGAFITDPIATETLQLAVELKSGLLPPEDTFEMPNPVTLTAEELSEYEGTFTSPDSSLITVTLVDDQLTAEALSLEFDVIPRDDGWFSLESDVTNLSGALYTVREIDGERILAQNDHGNETAIGVEFIPPAVPQAWQDRLGTYQITNPGDAYEMFPVFPETITLIYNDGLLYFDLGYGGLVVMYLEPVSDTEALTVGLGRSARETVFVKEIDGDEVIEYSGFQWKKTE